MNLLTKFIPMTEEELCARGWSDIEILFITGDAYVDHPAFGIPLLARLLENKGFRVGIISQPLFPSLSRNGKLISKEEAIRDFLKLGKPSLFIGIGSGAVDSMINNYTANKRRRSDDMYSPNNLGGCRPDYALSSYCRFSREIFGDIPIVIGGVEASLRRLAHYDYWSNSVKPSILIDSGADILVYGMAEKQILKTATIFKEVHKQSRSTSDALSEIKRERGICYIGSKELGREIEQRLTLPSFEEVRDNKNKYRRASVLIESEPHLNARTIIQYYKKDAIIVNPPATPLTTNEMDEIYALPFTREPHFIYKKIYGERVKIKAHEMIEFSVTSHRGCMGGCSFCSLSLHQGRFIQSRSEDSIIKEIVRLSQNPRFSGYISDVGGPTANMYGMYVYMIQRCRNCKKKSCIHPDICDNLNISHKRLTLLLKRARNLSGIKKVLIASGIRHDLALKDSEYMRELVTHHVGGHLKVAPEHSDDDVLKLMRKPSFKTFYEFRKSFDEISQKAGKEQYIVPYFISNFPSSTREKMLRLSKWLKRERWKLEQVQSFIPLPMTMASTMYYTSVNPYTGEKLHIPKESFEKRAQQKLLQPHK